jgi:uncharacterized protein
VAFFALYLSMPLLPPIVQFPSPAWMAHHVELARRIYGAGGLGDVLAFRIGEIPALLPLHVYVLPRTLALFMFGAFLWRSGVFQGAATQRSWLWIAAAAGIVMGLALTLATEGPALFGWPSWGRIGRWAEPLSPIVLALGYAAGVVALTKLPIGRRLLGWAEPLGRMAFTNYLVQSVVFGWLFYGYGLGLFDRLGAASALAIGVVVYVVQVLFNGWWLKRYRFGPMEWLWRTLMYGQWQPMKRGAA